MQTELSQGDDNTASGKNLTAQPQVNAQLPMLVDRAAKALGEARTAAEVLEARDMAGTAYDAAKSLARLAKAKKAHHEVISAVHQAQGDALEIEAQANLRLVSEFDAAQLRGEVADGRSGPGAGVLNGNAKATAASVGLSRKTIHEARLVRDAERADPGIVRRTVNEAVAAGEEPTKAKVRRAMKKLVRPDISENPGTDQPIQQPAFPETQALARAISDVASSMNHDDCSIKPLPAAARLTPVTFWEQLDLTTWSQGKFMVELAAALTILRDIMRAKPISTPVDQCSAITTPVASSPDGLDIPPFLNRALIEGRLSETHAPSGESREPETAGSDGSE